MHSYFRERQRQLFIFRDPGVDGRIIKQVRNFRQSETRRADLSVATIGTLVIKVTMVN